MLYSHKDLNDNSNTNTGKLLFQIRTGSLISGFSPLTWRDTNHKNLCWPYPHTCCLAVFKISIHLHRLRSEKLNCYLQWSTSTLFFFFFFKILILWTISSGYDVIHTSAPFPVWRFMTDDDCHILSTRV